MQKKIFSSLIVFFASATALAAAPKRHAVSIEESPFEYTRRFTVKVENEQADIFTGEPDGSHGTGFYVGNTKDRHGHRLGLIFTNNHVIAKDQGAVQKLTLEFTTEGDIPEKVPARIFYASAVYDFAVLSFKLSDIKKVKNQISPAPLPTRDHPLYQFVRHGRSLQGRATLAQGNPFDSEASVTFGNISTLYRDQHDGVFIQTQTPINEGNSGGPLIDLETGTVIGINTMKNKDADNVGFAIPIGVAMEEFLAWTKDPDMARVKSVDVRLGANDVGQMDVLGVTPVIKAAYPHFFDNHNAVIRVHDASPATRLERGDQIVKVGGTFLHSSLLFHDWDVQLQKSKGTLKVELVRNGALIEVDVPVRDETYRFARSLVDFVYISGLIFDEVLPNYRWRAGHHIQSSVVISDIIENSETRFAAGALPEPNSILVSVNIDNKDYPIFNLTQLKRVLYGKRGSKFIRLDVIEPMRISVNGEPRNIDDSAVGTPAYRSTTASYVVPMLDVITPLQFSQHRFERQFSFKQGHPETRDWHRFVKADRWPQACDQALTSKDEKASPLRRSKSLKKR
ncbi:MAG: S1C family serine protease [Bdellovibrionales bacterium]